MRVAIERPTYNERRYDRPWIGVVTSWPVGKNPEMRWGVFVGQAGSAGVLEIQAERHDIVRWGQKDKRSRNSESRWGVVLDSGEIRELKNAAEARSLWRQVRGPRGGRKKGVELAGAPVVEIPQLVMDHVQQLTEANGEMMQEIIRVRTALVHEGHEHMCNLVTGNEHGRCSCAASRGAGIITPEQMAERYPKLLLRIEQAAATEQQLRNLFSVPEGVELVPYCRLLVADIQRMNTALREALESQGQEVDDGSRN